MDNLFLYIILGILGAFVLLIIVGELWGYFVNGMPMDFFTRETEEQRRKREEKQAAKERRRASSWYEEEKSFDRMNDPDSLDDENLDMFGYPMDED